MFDACDFIDSNKFAGKIVLTSFPGLNDQGKLGIRTVNQSNAVEFRVIEILEDTTEGLWISGLGEDERIITLGQEYDFQGQTVKFKETSLPEA